MKISGFTMGKNVTKLYYPIKESILSILPICDEFIIALGKGDDDDKTLQEIVSIGSDKIKIIHTEWDIEKYPNGTEMAHQTDIAKEHCTGDWLFYIQADEVVHEKYLPIIKDRCSQLLHDNDIEGLLFKYMHFWGDYDHHNDAHGWYKNEIRIIRNNPNIHSWRDAQSFRRIPIFDGKDFRQEKDTFKLKVAKVDAYMYHYGWVRPPSYMKIKIRDFNIIQRGTKIVENQASKDKNYYNFDYGVIDKMTLFKDTHPKVLSEWVSNCNWKNELQYTGERNKNRPVHKHERLKNRFVTFLEKYVFFRPMWEFKNYILLKR